MGLASIVTLTKGNMVKGLLSGVLGLLLATVGMDPLSGYLRFSFGVVELDDGISFMPALIGLFSVSQILELTAENRILQKVEADPTTLKRAPIPRGLAPTILRGGLIGTLVGMLPGAGATISAFISYNVAKQLSPSRRPSAREIPSAWPRRRARTTDASAAPSFRCSPWAFPATPWRRPSWEGS
jgi:putative tricarboxylic transport membrane protein